MIAAQQNLRVPGSARIMQRRTGYLIAAICVALCTIMVMPLALTILASLKTTLEAAALPPTYVPHELSYDSYVKLWNYQAGLLTYVANMALLPASPSVLSSLTTPAGTHWRAFRFGKGSDFCHPAAGAHHSVSGVLTPIFFMFIQLKLTIRSSAGHCAYGDPVAVQFYIMRNAFESVPSELDEAATVDGCSSWQSLLFVYIPSIRPAIVTVSLFAFITSWNEFLGALVMMTGGSAFTLPIVLAAARTKPVSVALTGDCCRQASQFPLYPVCCLPAPAKILCFRLLSGL